MHFIHLRVVQKQLAATNKNVKFNCPLRPYEQEKLKKVHFSFAIVLCDMQMQLTSIPLSLFEFKRSRSFSDFSQGSAG